MSSVIPNLDLLGILCNVAVDGLVDLMTLATCDSQNQVIEGRTTKNINMVTYQHRQLLHFLAS